MQAKHVVYHTFLWTIVICHLLINSLLFLSIDKCKNGSIDKCNWLSNHYRDLKQIKNGFIGSGSVIKKLVNRGIKMGEVWITLGAIPNVMPRTGSSCSHGKALLQGQPYPRGLGWYQPHLLPIEPTDPNTISLGWWHNDQGRSPLRYRFPCKYICIWATSAPSASRKEH